MLRITCINERKSVTLKLEGQLAGPWVDETEKAWHCIERPAGDQTLIVDLNNVTSIDLAGRTLVRRMHEAGATFLAEGPYMTYELLRIIGEKPFSSSEDGS